MGFLRQLKLTVSSAREMLMAPRVTRRALLPIKTKSYEF